MIKEHLFFGEKGDANRFESWMVGSKYKNLIKKKNKNDNEDYHETDYIAISDYFSYK